MFSHKSDVCESEIEDGAQRTVCLVVLAEQYNHISLKY